MKESRSFPASNDALNTLYIENQKGVNPTKVCFTWQRINTIFLEKAGWHEKKYLVGKSGKVKKAGKPLD